MFLSTSNEDQSNEIVGVEVPSFFDTKYDFKTGRNASLHNERVVHGIVSDGHNTFPFFRDGMA
jgi:hypothetical protein